MEAAFLLQIKMEYAKTEVAFVVKHAQSSPLSAKYSQNVTIQQSNKPLDNLKASKDKKITRFNVMDRRLKLI